MMINNQQQIGIRNQEYRSVSLRNLPFEIMSNAVVEGFSSQQVAMELEQGTVTDQSWAAATTTTSLLSDTRFESRAECGDRNIISAWPRASEIGSSVHANRAPVGLGLAADSAVERSCATSLLQSKDTLQSLIQSSIRRNQNTESFEENFAYQISNEFQRNQPTPNKFRDSSHYPNISFQKNFQVENEANGYYHEGHNYSPIARNCSERATLMTKRNRMRWTQELHSQFIECVNRLGGAKKATPKGILKLMNCDGLTIFHVKSHLQKYRVARYIPEAKEEIRDETWRIPSPELDQEMGAKIFEALKMQIDVQRRLHEQLQCQKDLQSRIEEQAQQLKKMLDLQVHTDIKSAKDAN